MQIAARPRPTGCITWPGLAFGFRRRILIFFLPLFNLRAKILEAFTGVQRADELCASAGRVNPKGGGECAREQKASGL